MDLLKSGPCGPLVFGGYEIEIWKEIKFFHMWKVLLISLDQRPIAGRTISLDSRNGSETWVSAPAKMGACPVWPEFQGHGIQVPVSEESLDRTLIQSALISS